MVRYEVSVTNVELTREDKYKFESAFEAFLNREAETHLIKTFDYKFEAKQFFDDYNISEIRHNQGMVIKFDEYELLILERITYEDGNVIDSELLDVRESQDNVD